MANIRVRDLAKELDIGNKELIEALESIGITGKTHASGLEPDQEKAVRTALKKSAPKEEKPAAPAKEDKPAASVKEEKTAEKPAAPVKPARAAEKSAEKPAAPVKAEKPAEKPEADAKPEQPAEKPAERPAAQPAGEIPKKKSKPLMVFRPQNTKDGARRAQSQQNMRRGPGGPMRRPGEPDRGPANRPAGTRPRLRPSQIASLKEAARRKKEEELLAKQRELEEAKKAAAAGTPAAEPAAGEEPKKPAPAKPAAPARPAAQPADASRDSKGKDERKRKDKEKDKDKGHSGGKNTQQQQQNKRRGRKDKPVYDDSEQRSYKKPKGQPVKPKQEEEEEVIKLIKIPETLTIQELADKMKIKPSAIVKKLFMQGTIVTINQEIEYSMAEEIALDYDVLVEKEEVVDVVEEMLREDQEDEALLVKRPPVVCVMGHVDHGKTSLLDAIRDTHVIDKEAGGITQHIGAYVVKCNGEKITFLDTPGHEAFTSMRMRGANATDIAILVVAADDGVMPQTVEAINHAKAAGTEIIVAVNKIDKPGANVERVKQELTEHNLIAEEWGGNTVFCPVSAKTHEGIDHLLEMILLTAEVAELKANPDRAARGLVIEAELDKGKGPVATMLIQKGTLHVGDAVACGACYGKVRAMMDDNGRRVKSAGPSTPVEILGLNDVPEAGEVFVAPETEKEARRIAETFISQERVHMLSENKSRVKMSLEDLYAQIQEGNLKEFGIVVKADVQGSVEAVRQSLEKLSNEEVVVKVIHGGVGAINESDVTLAAASNAIIIGFNVRPDAIAKETAEREGVNIRLYNVIYNAIEDVEDALKGMLKPEYIEQVTGHAEIRQLFKASGVGTIAGSYVTDGKIDRDAKVRILRGEKQIYDGPLASLKRFKDDVKEVRSGFECGLVFADFNDVAEGDRVEAYMMVEKPR